MSFYLGLMSLLCTAEQLLSFILFIFIQFDTTGIIEFSYSSQKLPDIKLRLLLHMSEAIVARSPWGRNQTPNVTCPHLDDTGYKSLLSYNLIFQSKTVENRFGEYSSRYWASRRIFFFFVRKCFPVWLHRFSAILTLLKICCCFLFPPVHTATLFLNIFGCLAWFCVDSLRGVDFGLAMLWFMLFTPCSFVCWYRPLYGAFR